MLTYIYIESVTLGFKSTSSSILPCTSPILFHRASLSRYSITKNRHRSLQELFNRKGPQILQKHTTNPTLAPVWNHLSYSFSSSLIGTKYQWQRIERRKVMCRQSWFIMADGRIRWRTRTDGIETEGPPEADGIYGEGIRYANGARQRFLDNHVWMNKWMTCSPRFG